MTLRGLRPICLLVIHDYLLNVFQDAAALTFVLLTPVTLNLKVN